MAPNNSANEQTSETVNIMEPTKKTIVAKDIGTDYSFKREIYWPNVIGFLILHSAALAGFILCLTGQVKWQTMLFSFCLTYAAMLSVTMGAHRLYTHKCFKANVIVRFLLNLFQTVAGQNCMYIWVRDHRQHHRYSDTDGDPHNAKRGFFFSHIGWLMSRKHPLVKELGKTIDMSDLEADPLVMFQKKYYKSLYFVFAFAIPIAIPIYFWKEDPINSLLVAYAFRYIFLLNGTWLVNSAAHIYGTRPYDKTIMPVESFFVGVLSGGEGWHNYHHAFPWDYKAAELRMPLNATAHLIRFCARIGWAWDLKEAPHDMVRNRILKLGDGSHYELGSAEAQRSVTAAFGPVHALNPLYTSTLAAPDTTLEPEGLPLSREEADASNILRKRLLNLGS